MSEASGSPVMSDPQLAPLLVPSLLEEAPEGLYRAVRAGGLLFALCDEAILEWRTLEGDEVGRVMRGDGAPRVHFGGDEVPLVALEDLLPDWLGAPCAPPVADRVEVLVIESQSKRVAVTVEEVGDPLELDFDAPRGRREGPVLGAKVQPDGGVVFVLDAAEIVETGSAS